MTAMSDSLYQTLVRAGAPVGALVYTRTLCGANGTGIGVSGCSHCMMSFMGLQTEFPTLVCNLATGTDAIIGTDVLGSVRPHTLDINNGLRGASLQLHQRDIALSGRVFTVDHGSVPPYSEAVHNTGLVMGRTLVDPSRWRVPVLVSNFSQDTVMVEPFSEVGMVTQISAIQAITEPTGRPACGGESLPMHLLLDQTSRDLDDTQQHQLACVLLRYSDLFPVPGSTLTGHADAVEHEINTGDGSPIRCAPCRMSPQEMKKEEQCVAEILTGGQIEPSDSAWSSPVVVVTEKDGGTRFCVDYRRLNDATVKDCQGLSLTQN